MGVLNLKGQFSIRTYDGEDKLTSEKTYPNFITSTGLSFPYSIPINQCFCMLSVGSGEEINTVLTTGLSTGYDSLKNLNNYVTDACGTQETRSGVSLFRAWRVPETDYVSEPLGLVIKELGVHPIDLSSSSVSGQLFSRVLTDTTVTSGDYSIITYQLNVGLPTGIKSFSRIINTTQVNQTDNPVCRYWDSLSGRYSIIHNGIQTIDTDGLPVVPFLRSPMEPSCRNASELKAYLSTDNLQFTVNGYSGGAILTGEYQPYNPDGFPFGTGLCQYHTSISYELSNRLRDMRKDTFKIPLSTDFTYEVNDTAFVKVNSLTTITPDSFNPTGRTRSLVRLFSWASAQNLFEDEFSVPRRIKSLVLSSFYNTSYLPYCDAIFASSGLELNHSVDISGLTYNPTGITGDYVFIDPYDNLGLSFRLSWSSDCPDTVSGCPNYVP